MQSPKTKNLARITGCFFVEIDQPLKKLMILKQQYQEAVTNSIVHGYNEGRENNFKVQACMQSSTKSRIHIRLVVYYH